MRIRANFLMSIERVLMFGSDGLFCLRRSLSFANLAASFGNLGRISRMQPAGMLNVSSRSFRGVFSP